MKKTNAKRLVSILLTFVLLFCAAGQSASAANVCNVISGNSSTTTSFKVETKGGLFKGKLTLTQTKGVANGMKWTGGSKTYSLYGQYTVTYKKEGGKEKTVSWRDKNLTLKLDKNSTYIVTVKPDPRTSIHMRQLFKAGFYGWKSNAYWSVRKTSGVLLCR